MKVVAFYSFKGGVGRTMSLLSTAYMLARRGRKVVIADWDLQAPGLSLMDCMRPEDAGPPRVGILEYLTALHPENWEGQPVSVEQMLLRPRFIDEARRRPPIDDQPAMAGDLQFIPAGDLGEGVEQFIESVKRAELHNLKGFLVALDEDPRMVFRVFCEQVRNAQIDWQGKNLQGPPDYLLVDARTGITEIGDLLLGDATDFTAIVYGQDIQNLHGLEIVLNASQRTPGDLIANTMLIWSGAVAGQEELKVRQKQRKEELIGKVCRLDSLGLREPFPKEFNVPFNPDLVFSEVPLVHQVPQGEFADLFDAITDYLEERCLWRDRIIEEVVAPINPREPISNEQRRLMIASTPDQKKELLLQDAYDRLERSRGLTPLLFNPPAWNLAGIPTPEIVDEWPEAFSSANDRSLFLQLLAYSIALGDHENVQTLRQIGRFSEFQIRELLKILSQERSEWIAHSPVGYWDVIYQTISGGCEWLAMLVDLRHEKIGGVKASDFATEAKLRLPNHKVDAIEAVLRRMVDGEPLRASPEFAHALFPLLVAEAIRESTESTVSSGPANLILSPFSRVFRHEGFDSRPRILEDRPIPRDFGAPSLPSSYLNQWLADRQLDALEVRERLTKKSCEAAERAQLPHRVQGFCWERFASALDARGRMAKEADKASWFDRAIDCYERSLKLRPDQADTLHNLGSVLAARGRAAVKTEQAQWFDRAIACYERSLNLRPDDGDTLNNLGNALAARGSAAKETEQTLWFDRSIDCLMRSLMLRPDHADTLNNLGVAMAIRGRAAQGTEKATWFDGAIDCFERSLKLRPNHAATLSYVTTSLLNKSQLVSDPIEKASLLARAENENAKLLTLDPRSARYNYACLLALKGEAEQALDQLRQLLKEDPAKRQHVANDEDFESLADHPEFQQLISG